jgi:hypothetical protein
LEALQVVLTVIVVLVEDGDLGVRLLLEKVRLRIDAALRSGLVVGLPSPSSTGKFFGSFHLVAPGATNSCGTSWSFEVLLDPALFGGVPSGLKTSKDFIAPRQVARLFQPSSAGRRASS